MLFEKTFFVRWHDTDAMGEARPSACLTYMQECANHQFLTHAKSLDAIRTEDGVGFVLTRIAIDFEGVLAPYETVTAKTATVAPRGFTFPRRFELYKDGTRVAKATSQWALLRVGDHSPVRAGDFPLSFGDEEPIETDTPLRFHVPKDLAFTEVGTRKIVYSDLDYNMHMNNTHYPDMLFDFLPDNTRYRVQGMSLAFHREAAFGDTLTVHHAVDEGTNTHYFRTEKDGTLCLEAMVRVTERR